MNSSQNKLQKAKNLLRNNDTRSAIETILSIKGYNGNPDALVLLAHCRATTGDFHEAEVLFKKAVGLTGSTEITYNNIGLSQLHQGKVNRAIKSFLKAIRINKSYYEAIKNLAICYDSLNDTANTRKYVDLARSLNNMDPAIINIMAKHLLQSGNFSEAEKLYLHSLRLHKQQPVVYTQLAHAYTTAKKYDLAERYLVKLVETFPDIPYSHNSLAQYYESRNRHNDAFEIYEKLLTNHSDNIPANTGKARCLVALGKLKEAGDHLQFCLSENRGNIAIASEYCNYLVLTKKYNEAYNVSKNIISSLPAGSEVPEGIALSHSIACRHIKKLEEAKSILENVISGNKISQESLEMMCFSMGDVLDSMRRFDEAFSYYHKANTINPLPTDITYYESVLSEIADTIDRSFLDALPSSGNTDNLPVFIIGMPRSGTSLVEQIIASHSQVHGAGELTDLWKIGNKISKAMNLLDYTENIANVDYKLLKNFSDEYINKLRSLSNDAKRISDKLPHNFIHIGLIERLFPNAHIIHCERHPFDTCLSIYFKKFNDNHVYSRNLKELALFYRKYHLLMNHWKETTLLNIHTVRYEDIVMQQETESKKLIQFIGLEWEDEVLEYYKSGRIIMTPSYQQASRPIYHDSVNRWKNYSKFIQPLEDVLGSPEDYR